jgi:hypothetical protein
MEGDVDDLSDGRRAAIGRDVGAGRTSYVWRRLLVGGIVVAAGTLVGCGPTVCQRAYDYCLHQGKADYEL